MTTPRAARGMSAASDAGSACALRILLVEDDVGLCEATEAILDDLGHEVRVAHEGAGGIAVARAFHPDVLLCDIALYGELDGHAVARALRDDPDLARCHRVALTGRDLLADRVRAAEAGFDWYLLKPTDVTLLEQLLWAFAAAAAG